MPKKPIFEQVLVVTDAFSGLGRAIAWLAGARGGKVVVTARNAEALDNCVREIERTGSEALAVRATSPTPRRSSGWLLRRTGWKGQYTAERKPVDSPDILFDTLPGDPGAHGRFDDRARGSTLWTRLRLLLPKG